MSRAHKLVIAAVIVVLIALIAARSRLTSESTAPAASSNRAAARDRSDATAPVTSQPTTVDAVTNVATNDARVEIASNEVGAASIDIHGRVVDERGRPIETFALYAIHRNANNWFVEERNWLPEVHKQGVFDLGGLAPGRWEIAPRADGLSLDRPQQFQVTCETRIDFVMRGLAVIAGVVLDPRGLPVLDAKIFIDREASTVRTEVSGAFELYAQPGTHRLQATADGFASSDEQRVTIGTRDRVDVELTLHIGATLRGTVSDEMGHPIAGQSITCSLPTRSSVETDATGHFELAGIKPGRVKVFVSTVSTEPDRSAERFFSTDVLSGDVEDIERPHRFDAHFTTVELQAGEVKEVALRFAPQRSVHIVGHLSSAKFESIAGFVFLAPAGARMVKRDNATFQAQLDPSGYFEITLPTFGRFQLTSNGFGDGRDRKMLDAGMIDVPDRDEFELNLKL